MSELNNVANRLSEALKNFSIALHDAVTPLIDVLHPLIIENHDPAFLADRYADGLLDLLELQQQTKMSNGAMRYFASRIVGFRLTRQEFRELMTIVKEKQT